MKLLHLWPLLILLLTGCVSKVDVSATADTAGNVQYAYITIKGVWLNKTAHAQAADSGWIGKQLDTPITLNLTSLNNGSLTTLISGIRLDAGSYHSLRLLLVDNNETLETSANDSGLTHNNEVQYLDSSGSPDTQPLELADPSGNLIVPVVINIATAASGKNAFNKQQAGTTVVTTAITLDVDLSRGLSYFNYNGQAGVLFNAAMHAGNDDDTGTIRGSLDLSAIASAQLKNSQSIMVTAEALNSDGTRYIAVKNAVISSDGSFTLTSLPSNADTPTYYQVVIHGAGIQTVVIGNVPVNTNETTTVQNDAFALVTAASYRANTAGPTSGIPANTQVQFYQTLPVDSLPRLMEFATLNPFTGAFSEDVALPIGKVVYGEYNDANAITFTTVTPNEGSGSYLIGTQAPLHDASALTASIASTTANASITLPSLPGMSLSNGASVTTVTGTVTFASSAYNAGVIMLTHGGQLIDMVDISSAITGIGAGGQANFTFNNVAGNTAADRYEVSARVWNSGNPANTVARIAGNNAVDARSGDVSGLTITVP